MIRNFSFKLCLLVLFVRPGSGHWLCAGDNEFNTAATEDEVKIVSSNLSHASEWSMHRGSPQLQGLARGRISENPALRWSFDTGDSIKSSAAIVGNRIFIGSDSGKVHALDLDSGHEIWSYATEGPIEATPCVVNETVFTGSSDSFLYALDINTGKLKWKYQTGDKIMGGANWALNPMGDNVWILFGSYDGALHCVDAESGALIWKHQTEYFVNGTPAILEESKVVFGGCDSHIYILRLEDGTELKRIESGAYIASSIAIFDERGFVGHYNNDVLSFDLKAGSILWTYSDNNYPYFSSAAVTAEYVVIGSRDKRLHCINRNSGKGEWQFQTLGPIDSSPVVCDNKIIFGSRDGHLYILNLKTGKEAWSYDIGAPVTSSPAMGDGKIVIGSEDGSVYMFDAG